MHYNLYNELHELCANFTFFFGRSRFTNHQHMHDIGATGYDKTIRRVWRYQGGNQNAYIEEHNGQDSQWHCISSGSKAEGLNLPGSDFDVMFINKHIHVYELHDVLSNYHELRTKFNLVLDFDNAVAY
jgi:hypothetical protein